MLFARDTLPPPQLRIPLAPPPDSEKARRSVAHGDEETLGWRPGVGLQIPGREEVNFEKQLVTLGEGDYFGEVALLAADTRSATIRALTDLDVWVLKNERMQQLMDEDRELGFELLSVMSKDLCLRLTRANEDIRKLLTAFAIAINR